MDQANTRYNWDTIPWRKLEKNVFKLQKRIYQAKKRKDIKNVHSLQKLLLHSRSAKLLAIRRVTQDNRGKKTPGVDGKANLKPEERLQLAYSLDVKKKARPSKRVWISKPGKTEKRPLGIPTISDRASQTLMKMALEPEWEAKFEPTTYGFRAGRSCHDAIGAIYNALNQKAAYILDADIAGCFDNIDQKVLLAKLTTTPTFKRIIRGWLKAGVMEDGTYHSTKHGTIQGGTISPLLACVALHGIERHVKETLAKELIQHTKKKYGRVASHKVAQRTISVIFYADDFVVIHESEEIILKAKALIEKWLKSIGLELKPSKTKISHTSKGTKPGFNFLGFFIRDYPNKRNKIGYKLLIKPSKESRKQHTLQIKHKLKKMRGFTQEDVIKALNPIIRGWSQYYASVVSKEIYSLTDSIMFRQLWKWAVYRHPNKGRHWIKSQYFKKYCNDNWRFKASENSYCKKHSEHSIKRYVKVQNTRSPYDGDWVYWGNRLRKIPDKSPKVINLLKIQQGKCDYCQLWFKHDDILETHHKDRNRGNNIYENLSMLHGHCHDELHRKCP